MTTILDSTPALPRCSLLALITLVLAHGGAASADPAEPSAADTAIRSFLTQHCLACHGAEKPKGKLRVDELPSREIGEQHRSTWLKVLKRVNAGEMPPKSKP